ncbi:MAG: metallophosphoesterase family protein [Synergistaceae bacterium]|nr:metallophosphoesterase family protein [Synergistaceae bacterium]
MLYLTGDIHGDKYESSKLWRKPFSQTAKDLTKDDYVIIAGDFGWLWSRGSDRREEKALDYLEKQPYSTLFIDGNHENFDRLYSLDVEEKFGGPVGVLRPHVLHLKSRGHIYIIDGYRIWCFGGATSFDRAFRKEGKNWWPQEEPLEEEYVRGEKELEGVGWRVDLILTHDAPYQIAKYLLQEENREQRPVEQTRVTEYLQAVAKKTSFSRWYFGHYHKDRDYAVYGQTFGGSVSEPKYFSCICDRILKHSAPEIQGELTWRDFRKYEESFIWSSF